MSRTSDPWILGIGRAFHNGAACLLRGREIVAAVEEERLTRRRRAPLYIDEPSLAIRYCLAAGNIQPADLDIIVTSGIDGPWSRRSTSARDCPDLRGADLVRTASISHHLAHAESAYATAPWDDVTVLVIDGSGSFAWDFPEDERRILPAPVEPDACEHLTAYHGSPRGLVPVWKQASAMPYLPYLAKTRPTGMWPYASIGHLFASVSIALFRDPFAAGKVMGLAPYGEARLPAHEVLRLEGKSLLCPDTLCSLYPDLGALSWHEPSGRDLAATAQHALEGILLDIARELHARDLPRRLAYVGGVALNSVANRRLIRESSYGDIHILPAAEDSGIAIGAAYHGLRLLTGGSRAQSPPQVYFLGVSYADDEVRSAMNELPCVREVSCAGVLTTAAERLAAGRVLGWFDGGSEFGPRALGHRSILFDPRRPDGKEHLNQRVKHREGFRPYAPAVLEEKFHDWFAAASPHAAMASMLEVCEFRPGVRDRVPAVVHCDGTGRVQVVSQTTNPRFHALIASFAEHTGVPLVLNTSFNVMGEPIVETPRDALWGLIATGIDDVVFPGRILSTSDDYQGPGQIVPVWLRDDKIDSAIGGVVRRLDPRILGHIDGARTVDAICAAVGCEQIAVLRHVGVLFSARLVRVTYDRR